MKILKNKYQFFSLVFAGYPSVCMSIITFWNGLLPFGIKITAAASLVISIIFAVIAYIHNLKNQISTNDKFILSKHTGEIPNFNAEFYSKPGNFIIFCHNFDFIIKEKPEVMPILLKKAKEGIGGDGKASLTIWVKSEYVNSINVKKLKDAQAEVRIIPEGMLGDHLRFSIRENGDDKECILRHKFEDGFNPDTITYHKLTTHAHIVLLEEFVKTLRKMSTTST